MLYKSIFINTYKDNCNNFLEFNLSKLHKSQNNHKLIKIKKIQSRPCSKAIMEKLLLKNIKININHLHNDQNQKVYIYTNNLLQKLRSSGYISCIKIFNFNTPEYKYVTVNLTVNPIVQKITILNYKKLKIPKRFLRYVFKEQLGMPKNYNLINNSLRSIYIWYKSRGFAWVNIQLVEQDSLNLNTISLKIMEGTVKDVKLICPINKIYNPKLNNILELLIKKQLGIYPGSILNVKRIEAGIKYLTNLNLIEDCNYIVNTNRADLIVVIKYNISKNRTKYFYNYNLIFKNHSTYRQIYNLLNKCLLYIKSFNQSIINIQKFYLYSSITQMDQYLGFTYKLYYIKNNINNIFINLAVARKYPQFKIIFYYPYVYNQTKILSHLIIDLYNKVIKSYLCSPFLLLQLDEFNKNQASNLLSYINNYIFTLKHNLFNIINIYEKGLAIDSKYSKTNLYIKDYQVNQSMVRVSLPKTKIFHITKLLKYIRYNYIYLQISIVYNNLYFDNYLKSGKLLQIHSKLFTCITKNYSSTCHQLNYLGHNIQIKYLQIFNLPKIFAYIYYHTFTIFSECHLLVNSQKYKNILNQSYNNKHIYFKGSYKKSFPSCFLYLFNIEHHISKFKYMSIYCFWNYITYLYNEKQHNPYIKTINNIFTSEIIVGSGIKFYIPLKKLPNIRLEYSIDNRGKHFLKLRTDSKYNQ
uniref:hypothetical protein n=1 Tax=Polyopes affinis TaxID=194519 RepID=UPI002A7F2557|nr:hypothetical protein NDC12_pgp012 [Polyopes affinis]WOL37124.1 hypothetical protein [Polyopes affinis]